MDRYENIIKFFKKKYFEFLLENNITMVYFNISKTITFLIYQDELFIFDSLRSINKAYKFYNVESELCLEGIEYFKITKNYPAYVKKDDINIKNGATFKVGKNNYLINYFSKGYKNDKKLSLAKVNNKMGMILEFCYNVIKNDLMISIPEEKIAVVQVNKKINYMIDLYAIDTIGPNELSNKFVLNKELSEIISDKEAVLHDARLGLIFTDGYKDCLTLEETRCGGFIYYSLGDDNLMVYKFNTISLKEIYLVLQELFTEFLPLSLTTDNEFLYDILKKTFDSKIDFVLDKSNKYCRFIRELSVVLVLNNYTEYKLEAFCLIIENNFNSLVSELQTISEFDYELILEECVESYKLSNLDDNFDEFIDFEDFDEDEEVIEEHLVDTDLFS